MARAQYLGSYQPPLTSTLPTILSTQVAISPAWSSSSSREVRAAPLVGFSSVVQLPLLRGLDSLAAGEVGGLLTAELLDCGSGGLQAKRGVAGELPQGLAYHHGTESTYHGGAHVRGAGEIGVETLCFALADKIYQYLPANEGLIGAKVDGNANVPQRANLHSSREYAPFENKTFNGGAGSDANC
ncbi:hypothetical protein PCH_Pc20g03440 [Penicillium rubens Wisconsin 54-1255]|uniref:Uncharacterized protein n=1 Tax=Penicillium rubens (strain ATCC 28089 / DSM 1075 / NRRL 1951 / Wisconsin 54-1255) TaxID=500485 RepID=B6HG31_PENRW|nr:hypothetical protein PCH_Pc20g03440 [Penicillium rubens Wisconsin 54-1255]